MKKRVRAIFFCIAIVAALLAMTSNFNAQTSSTELNITAQPVTFTGTIPDQVIPKNSNFTDAITLSDYFLSEVGLIYNHTPVNNITIEINQSTSLVSFFPDAGFEGNRTVTFTATDGITNVSSNLVTLQVVEDNEAPKWSNPQRSAGEVERNDVINLTADWIDNIALKSFIFSINQGAGWVNFSGVAFTGTQNTSRKEIQITAAAGSTVSWRFSAQDVAGNSNTTDIQTFTLEEEPQDPDPDPDPEEDDPVTVIPAVTNLSADPEVIRLNIKQGQSTLRPLRINNLGTSPLALTLTIERVEDIVTASETTFEIPQGGSKALSLEITIPKIYRPDIYFGRALIVGQGIALEVPIIIEVESLVTDFEIEATVTNRNKAVKVGNNVSADITLRQTGDILPMEITMYYAVMDLQGNVLDSSEEILDLQGSSESFEKILFVPQHAQRGPHVFYARGTHEDKLSSSSDIFEVGERFDLAAFIRFNLLLIFVIIICLIIAMFMINYYRNKKKLRLLNLYLAANELKNLVKKKKFEDAVKVYVKLKAMYGEEISEEVLSNKEELKKEMEDLVDRIDLGEMGKNLPVEDKEKADKSQAGKTGKEESKEGSEKETDKAEEQSSSEKEKTEEKESEDKPEEKKAEDTSGPAKKEAVSGEPVSSKADNSKAKSEPSTPQTISADKKEDKKENPAKEIDKKPSQAKKEKPKEKSPAKDQKPASKKKEKPKEKTKKTPKEKSSEKKKGDKK